MGFLGNKFVKIKSQNQPTTLVPEILISFAHMKYVTNTDTILESMTELGILCI